MVERATPSVCIGFLRGLRFPPTMQTSPNIAYRAKNNQKVAYVLWLQYFNKKVQMRKGWRKNENGKTSTEFYYINTCTLCRAMLITRSLVGILQKIYLFNLIQCMYIIWFPIK